MSYPAINTVTMKVIAITDTVEQSHAHADISCPRDNFIIVDDTCYEWHQFTAPERQKLFKELTGKNLDSTGNLPLEARALNNALRNLELDETPLEQLNGKRPTIRPIHAEGHTVEPGALNTSSSLTVRPPVKKGPSIKTIVYELMDLKMSQGIMDEDAVPGLRIDLMNEMGVSHPHIKRTSVSTTLGQWNKERFTK